MKAGLVAAAVASLLVAAPRAQSIGTGELLERAADYVARFVTDFSNVVAEEEYRQEFQSAVARRRLKSDFLLVRYPGTESVWLAFRDVYEVNGRPVRDQQDRLATLFMEPFADAVRRAEQITRDGSRHSLVPLGPEASPLAVIALLQRHYQPGFMFRVGRLDTKLGPGVRALDLEERLTPEPVNPTVRRVPIKAIAWVNEDTGRIVKTEMRLGVSPNTRLTITTFRFDETLGIDVPEQMRDLRVMQGLGRTQTDQFTGVATYRRFRRFQVRTDEAIQPEPAAR